MSYVEQERTEQMDYIPDSEKQPEKEPEITCKKCIHKDVCYFLTRLVDEAMSMENSGFVKLPFSPYILANTCQKYQLKDGTVPSKNEKLGV